MAITIGQQLGSYEITALLGKGGMGEVYRARDTKLKRDVAIKILPDEFSRDADRVSRFQREAEALAALNHQNIGTIYDVQQIGETRFLILELVEGQTLQEKLRQGPIPVEEALAIAKQIAEALEAAHEGGVVHRDLKPGNIKLTPDGKVKVLDFGLAKAFQAQSPTTLSNSPTLMSASMPGVIVGTAAYMSPEQVKGRQVDRRTDIFAFGCVLYEMLTAKRAFDGETVTDLFASIIKAEPDWNALPLSTPEPLAALLRRCLQKDPRLRLQHIGDARIALDDAAKPGAAIAKVSSFQRRERIAWILVTLVLLTATVALTIAYFLRTPAVASAIRFIVLPPERITFGPAANAQRISPDGRLLMFVGQDAGGRSLLWVRSLDSLTAEPLQGTDGPTEPFWSPDSHFIAFFAADGKLKKIAVSGGPPQTIAEGRNIRAAHGVRAT